MVDNTIIFLEHVLDAEDLITYKLRNIQREISKILYKWSEDPIVRFLEQTQLGEIEESENDAIDLKKLVHEVQERFQNVRKSRL